MPLPVLRVLTVVRDVLALEGDDPSLDSTFAEDLGVDSLALLSLFMALEDEFDGSISEKEAEQLRTLRDVIEYIKSRLSSAGA